MIHEIKNQFDKHLIDKDIRNEVKHALDKGLDHTYYNGVKLEIVKDFRVDGHRETVVNVGF